MTRTGAAMPSGTHRLFPSCRHAAREPRGRQRAESLGWVLTVLLFLPGAAAAQKDAFVAAFIGFHSELSGVYGDEGPAVEALLGRMAATLDAWNTGNRAVEAALRSGPAGDPSALAWFFLEAGRPVDALETVETAIRLDPRHAGLRLLQGLLLDAAGRDADALAAFQQVWALDPDDPVNAYLLADRMSIDPLSGPPDRQLASLLAARGPAAGASTWQSPFIRVALIDDGASDEPRFSRAAYADGFAAFSNGRYEEAIRLFSAAMARDPLVADQVARSGPAARGVAALRQGRFTDAVAALDAAVAAAPASSEARRLLGIAHAAAGDVDASVTWLADAIRLAPTDERARVALGRVLMEAGRLAEAERILLDTIQLLPASGRTRWALADLYERIGRGTDAIDQLEQAAALTVIAGKAGLLWRLADLAHQLHDEQRVVSALARRTRLIPNDPFAHRSLGLAYHRAGRDELALIELLVSSRLGLEDAETAAVMGRIHLNAGRLTMAERVLRRAVAMAPDSTDALYALARTLLGIGQTQEGQQILAEFQRLQKARLDERRRQYDSDLQQRNEQLRVQETGR